MTEEGKQRGTIGTALVQYVAGKPSSFKEFMVIIVGARIVDDDNGRGTVVA